MKVGEIVRNATVAWSKTSPFLAAGTLAGTMSEGFDTSGILEIFDPSQYRDTNEITNKVSYATSEKFMKLIWSQAGNGKNPLGIIAGGMESGVINLWNPQLMLECVSK